MIERMPKRIDYTLTEKQINEIEQAIKNHPELQVRARARIIRLLHMGYKRPQVAHLLSISKSQVHYWYNRWLAEGIEGLSDLPRSGRPTVTTDEYNKKLVDVCVACWRKVCW